MRPKSLKIQSFKAEMSQQHHRQDQGENIFASIFGGMIPKSNPDNMSLQEPDNISDIHSNSTSQESSMEESLIVENGILSRPEEKFSGFKIIKVEMNSESSENKNKNKEMLQPKQKTIQLLDSIIYEVSDYNESVNYNDSVKSLECESINNSLPNSIRSNQTRGINRFDSDSRNSRSSRDSRRSTENTKLNIENSKESAGKSKQFMSTVANVEKKDNVANVSEFDLMGKLSKFENERSTLSFRKTDSNYVKEPEPSILPIDSKKKIKHDNSKESLRERIKNKPTKKISFEHNETNQSILKNEPFENQEIKPFMSTTDITKTTLESPIKEERPESNPLNIFAQIFGGSFSEKQNEPRDPKKIKEAEKTTEDLMIKFLTDFGITESNSKEMQNIKNMMINQKNLKLKDYLRLTSLSSDSKFDRYSKSLTKRETKLSASNHNILGLSQRSDIEEESSMLKSKSFLEKSKSPIDTERSIELIKASLKKKLNNAMKLSENLFKEVDEGSNLVGQDYEDLVFMCNFHRVYDENMFKTVQLLEELFEEYQSKRKIKKNINQKVLNDEEVTHEDFIEIINSPTKKKKKGENSPLDFIQKLLLNLKIIKNSEIKSQKDEMESVTDLG